MIAPHHSDYSEKYLSLSTVPGRGSVNFICFKYLQFQELVASWRLFFQWNILPNGSRMDSTHQCRGSPPPNSRKNMATNVTECVCVCTTFYSIHPFLPVVCLGPKVMIYCKSNDDFFLTPTLPSLNGAKCHTNAISSPSTLVVPNDEVLRLDWSKGPAGAPWGTPSTWQKEMVSLEGAGWKHQISED